MALIADIFDLYDFLSIPLMKPINDLKFITNEPAILLPGQSLVIADLHIGAESRMRAAGMKMPSQIDKLLKNTINLIKKTKAKKLFILGDIKQQVPGISFQEEREVPIFFKALQELVEVHILPGNHDGKLEDILKGVEFHPSTGILYKNFYLMHGNTWPSKSFLEADYIILGHNHPVVKFRDKLGYSWRERVWVRSNLNKSIIKERYKKLPVSLPELIVMPAYNPIVGGKAINEIISRTDLHKQSSQNRPAAHTTLHKQPSQFMGPLAKSANAKTTRVFLLDGTLLGTLGKIKLKT